MTRRLPTGIIGATLTPFRRDGTVDDEPLRRLIDMMVTHCDAISVLGAEVSEYQVLSGAERRSALRSAIRAVDSRVPVIAGASSPAVAEVVELSELAAEAGAEYVQVLMPLRPWGGEAGGDELLAYITEVSRRSALPVVAYHNPARGTDPSPQTMVRISELERVVAFKESSRDLAKIGRLCEEIDVAGKARYFTTMQPLLATLQLGGSGAMAPPPATLIAHQVLRAYRRGDHGEAERWQRMFSSFPARWKAHGLAPVMKAAMRCIGIDLGRPAVPYPGLSDEQEEELGSVLRTFGLAKLPHVVG